MKHLFGISDLSRDEILEILRVADSFVEVGERSIPKVPALRGKTIVTLFFEDSTRTKVSFEMAAKRLSADIMSFAAGSSSLKKGESIRDTVQTISAMGVDAFIVRHKSSGIPQQISQWTDASIINAGDGAREHPTQALLDCLTLQHALKRQTFEDVRIAYVGDFAHSRVARSGVQAFTALGAQCTVIAPPTMIPSDMSPWPVEIAHNFDEVLTKFDVIYTIRPQQERIAEALLPSMREYVNGYSITNERFARLDEHVLVMEAGPLLRGVQMSPDVADNPRCLINKQVANGVPVRMAVLFLLLQGEREGKGI